MVTADLHGNRLNFDYLVKNANLHENSTCHLVMQEVCHGGPVYPASDGCMSHLLLEDVARLKADFPDRFHFLLSNHEWAEMIDFPIMKSSRLLNVAFRAGLQQMYGDATEAVRAALIEFLGSCPLAVRVAQNVVVCHSAPARIREQGFDIGLLQRPLAPDDYRPHGDLFRLLWGRDFSETNGEAFAELLEAEVLLHGHEPCRTGFSVPNPFQIILDCCHRLGSYVVIPTDASSTHAEVVDRVRIFESF